MPGTSMDSLRQSVDLSNSVESSLDLISYDSVSSKDTGGMMTVRTTRTHSSLKSAAGLQDTADYLPCAIINIH